MARFLIQFIGHNLTKNVTICKRFSTGVRKFFSLKSLMAGVRAAVVDRRSIEGGLAACDADWVILPRQSLASAAHVESYEERFRRCKQTSVNFAALVEMFRE